MVKVWPSLATRTAFASHVSYPGRESWKRSSSCATSQICCASSISAEAVYPSALLTDGAARRQMWLLVVWNGRERPSRHDIPQLLSHRQGCFPHVLHTGGKHN